MLVEDSLDLAHAIQRDPESEEYFVFHAGDGRQALVKELIEAMDGCG